MRCACFGSSNSIRVRVDWRGRRRAGWRLLGRTRGTRGTKAGGARSGSRRDWTHREERAYRGRGADGCDRPRLVTETDRPRRVDADLVHARRGAGRSHKPPLQPPTREPQGKREPARRMSVPRFQRAGAVPEPLSSQRWSRALLPRTRRASVGPVGGDGVAHGRHGMGVGGRVGERHKSRRRGPERPAVKTRPAIAHFASVARSSTRRLDVEPLQDAAEARSTDLCRAA
jgi:hypothetical protein